MTGFTFLSRLTQIAPPYTRFVFPGAGFRLGLPSHPASRRRSCLRLGVSITSSSRGLSPPSDRPCRAYSRRRLRRRWPGVSGGLCLDGPPAARRVTSPGHTDQNSSHGHLALVAPHTVSLAPGCPASRLLRQRRPSGVATRSAMPTIDAVPTRTACRTCEAAGRAEQLALNTAEAHGGSTNGDLGV